MAEAADVPAWIALFVGLYSLAAGLGEWRTPGYWSAILADFERQPGLRFVTGFLVLSIGGAIYMINPWRPDDWLSIVIAVVGGIMAFEGAVILAMGDRFLGFARWLIGRASRAWAPFSVLLGIAFVAAALIRI